MPEVCLLRTWVVKHGVIGIRVEQHPVVPAHPSKFPSATARDILYTPHGGERHSTFCREPA